MSLPAICAELRLQSDDGVPTVNSRDLAELAEKRHDNVLADIDRLLESPEILGDPLIWFREVRSVNEQNGQTYRSFDLTRKGFTMVVTGWNGYRWIAFRARYIIAFDAMEAALNGALPVPAKLVTAELDKMLDTKLDEKIGPLRQEMREEFGNLVNLLSKGRKEISVEDFRKHIDVIEHVYVGLCPCRCEQKILTSENNFICDAAGISRVHIHHQNGPHRNSFEDTIPLFKECHKRIENNPMERMTFARAFEDYHRLAQIRSYRKPKQLKLFS